MYRNLRLLSALQMMTGDERLERQLAIRDNKNSNEGEKLHRSVKVSGPNIVATFILHIQTT